MQLIDLEDSIDKVFLSGSEMELRLVLREYWTFHIKAIRAFQRNKHLELNLKEVREEIKGLRVSV